MPVSKIKQLRLANGWTLDELVAKIGGVVTKQAISKYEMGLIRPSVQVLTKIANAFNVKTIYLLKEPKYRMELIAYRKKSDLRKKEQIRIENCVKESLEERLHIQDLVSPLRIVNVSIRKFSVNRLEDVEEAADQMRLQWSIGKDQISSVVGILENNLVHVLEVNASDKFDGIAAVAYDDGNIKGAAIVVRKGVPGERQRLNLAHELGHLVLKTSDAINEEKAAFRFGAAFLAPKEWILREVGTKRTALNLEELFILKKKLGMSIQALLYRLKDLEVISENYYSHCFRVLSSWGWKKEEPQPIPVEKTEWLKQNVYKAFAEGLMSQKEAEVYLGRKIEEKTPLSLEKIRSFMKLSLEDRKRILAEQAEKVSSYYKDDASRDSWQAGDFIEQ